MLGGKCQCLKKAKVCLHEHFIRLFLATPCATPQTLTHAYELKVLHHLKYFFHGWHLPQKLAVAFLMKIAHLEGQLFNKYSNSGIEMVVVVRGAGGSH